MLMIVMSLAISLASTLPQTLGNQQSQSSRVQQEKKDEKYPIVLNIPSVVTVQPIALPAGDNAWAVQIVSRGGLDGSGRGDLTLASDGILYWKGADGGCSRKLSDETMNTLTKVVLAAEGPASATERSVSGMCGDCYVTAMILQQRTATGVVRASTAIWDDVSQAKIHADLITVYESLMALRGCKLQ